MATYNGTAGANTYVGTASADTIHGYGGDDQLEGMAGDDTVYGGDGDDLLIGDAGNDKLYGEAGNDNLFDDAGNDRLDGGAGYDIAYYSFATAGVTVNLALTSAQNTVGAGTDTLVGIEGLSGSNYNDKLYGDANDNILKGDLGADLLSGGAGDDLFLVSDAAEVVSGEHYIGGTGWDILDVEAAGANLNVATVDADVEELYSPWWISLTAGQLGHFQRIDTGTVTITAGGAADLRAATVYTDAFNLAVGGVTLNLGGTSLAAYTINGSSGDDVVTGGLLNDHIVGSDGNDTLNGDGGDDNIDGGAGNDTLYGGDGADHLTDGAGTNALHGGAGDDTIDGGDGSDTIDGDDGNDTINASGGNDTVHGGIGDDTLNSSAGNDTVYGGDGADIFNDYEGVNHLYGEAGDDSFYVAAAGGSVDGGAGNDSFEASVYSSTSLQLTGGLGDDFFRIEGSADYLAGVTLNGGDGIDTLSIYTDDVDISSILGMGFERLVIRNYGASARLSAGALSGLSYVEANNLYITAGGVADVTGAELMPHDITLDTGGITLVLTGATSSSDYISGGFTVVGSPGADNVTGGDKYDIIYGNDGNDTLNGGAGNDQIYGGQGLDNVNGGTGDDVLYISDQSDIVAGEHYAGGDGYDTLYVGFYGIDLSGAVFASDIEEIATQYGSHLSLTAAELNGHKVTGAFDVTITAAGTADLHGLNEAVSTFNLAVGGVTLNLSGATGTNYTVNGSVGADVVTGGGLDDTLRGDAGGDTLNGDGGNDAIYGDDGNDTLNGGAGSDDLTGGAGVDQLNGGDGNDTLFISAQSDAVAGEHYLGGAGTDQLWVTAGVDLSGLTVGADIEQLGSDGGVSLTSAQLAGFSYVSVSALNITTGGALDLHAATIVNMGYTWDVSVVLYSGGQTITLPNDTVHTTGFEVTGSENADTVVGGYWNDHLYGNGGVDKLSGGNGSDLLDGGVGADTLNGDAGDDYLYGGDGNDVLHGGDGNDILYGGAGTDLLDGGAGDDVLHIETVADIGPGAQFIGGAGVDALFINQNMDISGVSLSSIEAIEGGGITDVIATAAQLNHLVGLSGGSVTITTGGMVDLSAAGVSTDRFILNDAGNTLLLPTGEIQGGNFEIHGGAGADTVSGGYYSSTFHGGGGNDVLTAGGAAFWLYGDEGNDALTGNWAADNLYGGVGDDLLQGGGGNDVIDGGDGIDTASYAGASAAVAVSLIGHTVSGGAGNDGLTSIENLIGSKYADTLTGDAGANVIEGGAGVDTLDGGDGVDTLSYAGASGVVSVNLATGTVSGAAGADVISHFENVTGSAFNDTLKGDTGANALSGGAGNDMLHGDAGADVLDGGAGSDTADYSEKRGVVAVALNGTHTVTMTMDGVAEDTLIGIENVTGGFGNDVLTGDAGANQLIGGKGNDWLMGKGGADVLDGGIGVDTADYSDKRVSVDVTLNGATDATVTVGGAAEDTIRNIENLLGGVAGDTLTGDDLANQLSGWAGDDVLNGAGGNDVLDGGAGADTMAGGLGDDVYKVDNPLDVVVENPGEGIDRVETSISYTLGANVENLTLTGALLVNGTGNELDNVIIGNAKANVLSGAEGHDTLQGGDGNDRLDGGAGIDTMIGGMGSDTYVVDNTSDAITESSGQGTDSVEAWASYTLAPQVENLTLMGSDAIDGTGNNLVNVIQGNDAANVLAGLAGNDKLYGGGGDDTLQGGDGSDFLQGDGGADHMSGGTGADIFYFNPGDFGGATPDTADHIEDFSRLQKDHINLSAIDANTSMDGNQPFSFIGVAAFHDVAGELRYEIVSGVTYVTGDVNGDGVADFMLTLDNGPALYANDFIL